MPVGEEHPDLVAALQLVREAGIHLDEWQERVFRCALLRNEGRWAAFAVGVCCPRQNGKNALLEAVELAALFVLGEKLIIHSAHQADTAKEAFRRLGDVIESNPWLESEVAHMRYTNGHEAIELKSGQRIRFRTRTMKSGRGFSGDRVIFDEAMYLSDAAMGSMLPVISAQPDPQIWYTGSAVDQYVHEDGIVFARVRERALSGTDPRLYYAEWSVDADTPDDFDEEMAADMSVIAMANPALGIRIAPEYIEAERRELDARTFAVERGGAGDWPPTDASATPVIDLDAWDATANGGAAGVEQALAYDVAPDQQAASVCLVSRHPDGRPVLEVLESRPGARWLVPVLASEADLRGVPVFCGGSSPAEAFVTQLAAAGVDVEVITAADHTKACGVLTSLVNAEALYHHPNDGLRAALKGAARRPYGDAWLWSRKHSAVNITPLVGVTLALWGAVREDSGPSDWTVY